MEKARTVVGTPYYLSPEIIENKPYSQASDIWSLGALLYELCALTPPFTGNSIQYVALKIVKGSYANIPGIYSNDLKTLIRGMLNIDPNKRPKIQQILSTTINKCFRLQSDCK
jgi:NIMA (never in mitosis gene a)-related kinase